jgi:transposase
VATAQVVVFLIHRLRNAAVVMQLLGPTVRGILSTDRWTAYDWVPLAQRQICWVHLKRNFEKLLERGKKSREIGQACLNIQQRVFELWHLFRVPWGRSHEKGIGRIHRAAGT